MRAVEDERTRIQRNAERREARERLKGKIASGVGSLPASVAGSPGLSDVDTPAVNGAGSANGTPQKGRGGRNKDGTSRKCANCGQVGHIKTNRKSVCANFTCPICGTTERVDLKEPAKPKSHGGGLDGADIAGFKGATPFAGDSYVAFVL